MQAWVSKRRPSLTSRLNSDPAGFVKNSPEDVKARRRLVELQNGRLAMIGIISFLSANAIDGAVPALPANF